MVKRYIVELTSSERDELLVLIAAGESLARKLKLANILLLSDEGRKDQEIAEALHTSVSSIERTRKRWTMQLLANRLVGLKVVDQISDETVRKYVKKASEALG